MKKTVGRPKSFNEKEILEIAMNYFWNHGYDNSSLDDLLKAMNIKKGSFYNVFESKEELFSRTLDIYIVKQIQLLNDLKNKIGAKATLLALVDGTITELKKSGTVKGCLLINSSRECYQRYHNLSHKITLEFNAMQNFMIEIVKEAQRNNEITNSQDPKILAGLFMNALNGLVVSIQAGANKELIQNIVENLKLMIE